ncbi:LIM domain-containing protein WLIM2b [Fagus crenata]
MTRSPSKAASMFSGTQEKCATCGKTAYPLEKVTVESQSYHKSCFKCSHGGCPITPSNYAALEGILYCKHHFSQLFKEKGSYNHLIKSASMKRAAASVPEA